MFKDDLRLNAYGTIDELNSFVGLVRDVTSSESRKELLEKIQSDLFTIASNLAAESEKAQKYVPKIKENSVEQLESEIDAMEESLEPLRNFILPGGHQHVSFCHIARTVCRRGEREVIALSRNIEVDQHIIKYLNRLSDYLFVLARKMAKEVDAKEVSWKGKE